MSLYQLLYQQRAVATISTVLVIVYVSVATQVCCSVKLKKHLLKVPSWCDGRKLRLPFPKTDMMFACGRLFISHVNADRSCRKIAMSVSTLSVLC